MTTILLAVGLVDRDGAEHRLVVPFDGDEPSSRTYNLIRAYMAHHGAAAYVAVSECELADGGDALVVVTVTKAGSAVQVHQITTVAGRRMLGPAIAVDELDGTADAMLDLLPADDTPPDARAEVDLRELLAAAGIEVSRLH